MKYNPPFVPFEENKIPEESLVSEQQVMRHVIKQLDCRKVKPSTYPVPGVTTTDIMLSEQPYRGKGRARGRAALEAILAKLGK